MSLPPSASSARPNGSTPTAIDSIQHPGQWQRKSARSIDHAHTRYGSGRGSAVAAPPLAWVGRLLGWMGEAFRLSERSIGPVVDLLIRLRLAQIFFVSGVLKAADFEHAIYLSTH